MTTFEVIIVANNELSLENVLQTGQAFRWVFDESTKRYSSTMRIGDACHYSFITLRQPNSNTIEFSTTDTLQSVSEIRDHLIRYFRLDVSLNSLFNDKWIPNDKNFKKLSPQGIRILAQEPWETLVSFICSSNNNISRITKMCHSLCTNYGNEVCTYDGNKFYSFPTSDELASKATESELRELGFGYRAKYIIETAKKVVKDRRDGDYKTDSAYFEHLRSKFTYEEMREHLMSYVGVGPKVADCVCLMGFRMDEIVPVDVHIGRIATRDYRMGAKKKQLDELRKSYVDYPITKKKVKADLDYIRIEFLKKWGPYAGWAQGILFAKEIGTTSGATSTGVIKKRAFVEIDVKVEAGNGLKKHLKKVGTLE
ncbi:hypothetical protein NCAS_0A02860 [Naumovozyma castellii]|uniref:N-glycosylase/DNA lyase n=1 Tax=Naumovozyma castellii TaxID=27288 RepID=G0V5V6_NAUCA|nr:hypothetical protein NCAS_0A02860 [Naumovozyma castellii CBS 4309]CCC66844.1 hypothetical protein NCAS_0A02860 [Naumovozyma castellii CBS 4309]